MPGQTSYKEEQLFASFRMGSEAGLAGIFNSLYPALCLYANSITADMPASQDIAEEAFIRIWNRWADFDNFYSLQHFLYRTVRNASIDWLRRQETAAKTRAGIAALFEPAGKTKLDDLIRAETFRQLHSAINELPTRCRQVISLSFLEGKTGKEVAKALNIELSTVKSHKAAGLVILRKKIKFLLPVILF